MSYEPYLKIHDQTYSLDQVLGAVRLSGSWGITVQGFIHQEAVYLLAQERGVSVSDEELQTAIDGFRKMSGLFKADDARTWLAGIGQTLEDLEHQQETVLLQEKLSDGIDKADVEKFFDENRSRFDAARYSMLQVADEGVAREFIQQIEEGEANFHDLALEHSTHEESRPAGGYLGWRRRSDLNQESADQFFSAESGGVIGPIAQEGFFIVVRIDEVKMASELTREIESEIRKVLLQQDIAKFLQDKGVEKTDPWKLDPATVES